jgi:hypothetical protein
MLVLPLEVFFFFTDFYRFLGRKTFSFCSSKKTKILVTSRTCRLLGTNYITAYKERNYNLGSLFVDDVKTHAAKILNLMKDPID